jgi:phospholipase C
MSRQDVFTRRRLLEKTAAAGVAVLGGTLWATSPAAAPARRPGTPRTPIRHLIVSCQENHSFDHYFGYAPPVQAKGYGPPPGYTQPDAVGGAYAPFEFTQLSTGDPPHWWEAVHAQVDGGKMDGSS